MVPVGGWSGGSGAAGVSLFQLGDLLAVGGGGGEEYSSSLLGTTFNRYEKSTEGEKEETSRTKRGTALDDAAMEIISENIRPKINGIARECKFAAIANP